MALEITDSNFEGILKEGKPVVVDFWAPWCGPCKVIAPFVEEVASLYEGRVAIGKCNVDDNSELPAQYGIRNIPTLIFFKDGEQVDKLVGAVQKSVLIEKIESLL